VSRKFLKETKTEGDWESEEKKDMAAHAGKKGETIASWEHKGQGREKTLVQKLP